MTTHDKAEEAQRAKTVRLAAAAYLERERLAAEAAVTDRCA